MKTISLFTPFVLSIILLLPAAAAIRAGEQDPKTTEKIAAERITDEKAVDAKATDEKTMDENPGLKYLEEATERKLQPTGDDDLSVVIGLCEKAIKEGLVGGNLDFARQLLAATRLQRGLFLGDNLLNVPPKQLPKGWETIRTRAMDDLRAAAEVDANQPKAYLMLAQLATLPPGDEKIVTESLEKAIAAAGDDKEIRTKALLMQVLSEKDSARREELLNKALEESDDAPELLMVQVGNYVQLEKYDEAIEVLKKLIEQMPDNPALLHMVLEIRLQQEKFDDALKVLDVLLEGDPRNKAGYLLQKARIFELQQKYDEAIATFDLLLKDDPRDEEGYLFQKARILAIRKKYDEAIPVLDELRRKRTDDPQVLWLRGAIHLEKRNYEKAMKDADAALRLVPDYALAKRLRIDIFAARKDFVEAEKAAREMLAEAGVPEIADTENAEAEREENPEATTLRLHLASVYLPAKKSGKALEITESVLDGEPDNLFALRIKANALLNVGRHSDAAKTFEAILEQEPEDEVVLNNLSWLLSTSPLDTIRNGKRALELATKASELSEYKKAYILSTLAAAYAELGEFDKAIEWSQKSVDTAEQDDEEDRIDELKKELESYRRNEPWREQFQEESAEKGESE